MTNLLELPAIRQKAPQRRASSFVSHSHFQPQDAEKQEGRTMFLELLKKNSKKIKLQHNFSLLRDVFSPTKYCQMNLSTFDSLKGELKRSIQCKIYGQQIINKPFKARTIEMKTKVSCKNVDIELFGSASKVSKRTDLKRHKNPESNLKRQKKYLQSLQSICKKPSFFSVRELCEKNKFWNNGIVSKRATIIPKEKGNKSEDPFQVNGW